ncbi:MAG: DUF3467 domain-containing protein [Bacteroidales bacterium]|jgi:hypothetical protein|nr:DUF3467 domain-containing protein [Bacteroidales bacterium]
MKEEQKGGQQLNIEVPAELADGVYTNLAVITHSPTEFILDFVSMMPGVPKAKVRSRVVLAPQHAKRLLRALQDNISKYESVHGTIKEISGDPMLRGPMAQA